MDVDAFVNELSRAVAEAGCFERVALEVVEHVVNGRGYVAEDTFLRFYFNERTKTTAFALVHKNERIWGIDHDYMMGWHRHPMAAPGLHTPISPMSVTEIIRELTEIVQVFRSEVGNREAGETGEPRGTETTRPRD